MYEISSINIMKLTIDRLRGGRPRCRRICTTTDQIGEGEQLAGEEGGRSLPGGGEKSTAWRREELYHERWENFAAQSKAREELRGQRRGDGLRTRGRCLASRARGWGRLSHGDRQAMHADGEDEVMMEKKRSIVCSGKTLSRCAEEKHCRIARRGGSAASHGGDEASVASSGGEEVSAVARWGYAAIDEAAMRGCGKVGSADGGKGKSQNEEEEKGNRD